MTRGWLEMSSCPRGKKSRKVLVWHVYQMCMVYDSEEAHHNRFIVRWQEIPDKWIATGDRLPDYRDADPLGVVIVRDSYGDIRLCGWRQSNRESGITHWMPTPEAPDNYLEMRKAANSLPRRKG